MKITVSKKSNENLKKDEINLQLQYCIENKEIWLNMLEKN